MALAALIIACETNGGDREALRATQPFLGHTLLEHQARQAIAAGAGQVIVLVERVPAALTAALDRLRRQGLRVHVARNLADAADRVHPDEQLLLIADGCLAEQAAIAAVAAAMPTALLTVGDGAATPGLERIDATSFWAGLALLDGATLRRTAAAMPGDWDAQSTLLRSAVQAGGRRVAAAGAAPIVAGGVLHAREGELLARPAEAAPWPRRLIAPIERALATLLARRGIDPLPVAGGAAGIAAIGGVTGLLGWSAVAAALLVLASLPAAAAARLARVRLIGLGPADWFRRVRDGAAALAAAGLALRQTADGQWGWLLVGALAIMAAAAAPVVEQAGARSGAAAPPLWRADPEALAWAALAPLLARRGDVALIVIALYAAITLTDAIRRLIRAV